MMLPYDAYVMFEAMKLAYKDNGFDYHKYNGKCRRNPDLFDRSPERWTFRTILQKYPRREDLETFFFVNVYESPTMYHATLLEDESWQKYLRHKRYIEGLGYYFGQDIIDLALEGKGNFKAILEGEDPIIYRFAGEKKIHRETFVIIDQYIPFMSTIKVSDQYIWPIQSHRLKVYQSFVKKELANIEGSDAIIRRTILNHFFKDKP